MGQTRRQERLIEHLWQIGWLEEWVRASIWTHPVGWELRLEWDSGLAWSRAHADLRVLHQEADEARLRLEAVSTRSEKGAHEG